MRERTQMNELYTATAVALGDGRNGHVQSPDGFLDTPVRTPKELGGAGGATNPEQLFAGGYAACFHQVIKLVGTRAKADTSDSEVVADVTLLKHPNGAYSLAVQLEITLPKLDRATAEDLVAEAHQVCAYSNAIRGNIEVALTIV